MPEIEELDEKGEVIPRAPSPKKASPPKKGASMYKGMTRAQIAEAATKRKLEEIDKKMEAARQKLLDAEQKRQTKRNLTKATKAAERNVTRKEIQNRLLSAAKETGLSFEKNELKLPAKGAKMEKIANYLKAAKARYYKRTKKPNSVTREAIRRGAEEHINAKYIKRTATAKNVNAILAAARKKMEKAVGKVSGKTARIELRDRILKKIMEEEKFLSMKEAQKAACYRSTDERKKP